MNTASTILVGIGFAVCALFVVLYLCGPLTRRIWYRSEMGWHMMAAMAVTALVQGLILAYRLFGDYPGRQVVTLVAYAVFVASLGWRTGILARPLVAALWRRLRARRRR